MNKKCLNLLQFCHLEPGWEKSQNSLVELPDPRPPAVTITGLPPCSLLLKTPQPWWDLGWIMSGPWPMNFIPSLALKSQTFDCSSCFSSSPPIKTTTPPYSTTHWPHLGFGSAGPSSLDPLRTMNSDESRTLSLESPQLLWPRYHQKQIWLSYDILVCSSWSGFSIDCHWKSCSMLRFLDSFHHN